MNTIVEPQQNDIVKKQLYLQRVNQFYTDIRNWLQNELLILEQSEIDVIEALGQYKAPQLSIKTETGELLAKFQPTGASVLLAEGAMDVKGGIGLEYVLYLLRSAPQTFFKVDTDGWYWQEQREDVDPHLLKNKSTLLQLIT